MPNNKKLLGLGLLGLALLLLAEPAFASTVLDTATDKFKAATDAFGQRIKTAGMVLLFSLASIQLSINVLMLLIKQIDMDALLGSIAKWVLSTGFFAAVIKFSDSWLPTIINSFDMLGQTGSGLTHLTPSAIISQGIDLQNVMITTFAGATGANKGFLEMLQNLFPAIMMAIIALISLLSFIMLAAQMALTMVSGYLWLCVTPLLMGFGGISFTKDIAINAIKGGIAIGMKIMVVYLIASIAGTLAPIMGESMKDVTLTDWSPMYWSLALSMIMAYLTFQLPKLAADLMNGTASLSAGDAGTNMMMAAAAVAGVGTAAVAAAKTSSAALQGGANALAAGTGLMKALGAGAAAGADIGKSGIGKAMHAVGEVAGQAAGMATQGIGSAVSSAGEGFSSRVANSTGGRIASSIDASRGGSMGPAGGATSSGNAMPSGNAGAAPAAPRNLGGYMPSDGTSNAGSPASSAASALGGAGDASTASFSGGGDTGGGSGSKGPGLHQRIRDSAGNLPQDSHTVALNANVSAHVD